MDNKDTGAREEDMGASEMSKDKGMKSQGMDEKIEEAAEMGGREEDMGAREMGEVREKGDEGKM